MPRRPHWWVLLAVMIGLIGAVSAQAAPRVGHARVAHIAALKARVQALAPSAQAQVQQAAAAGPAALGALSQRVLAMPLAGPGTTTPQQYALLQALQPQITSTQSSGLTIVVTPPATMPSSGVPAVASASTSQSITANIASACWYTGSHIWDIQKFYLGPAQIGDVEKDHSYWCGNGYSITDDALAGYYHKGPDSTPPYCQATINTDNGWDAAHSAWAHGHYITHFGEFTPWTTCVTWTAGDVAVRIAANGYWDKVDDF